MIQVTDAAARRIRTLMAKQGVVEGGLRVGVKAGGCSGLSYVYDWAAEPRDDDQVFEGGGGIKIFVDPKSYPFLKGTVLDCDENMLGQSLVFKNPNASISCGCGSSFGV
ncbi:MAG: iron-sulfur cluster assembly accessory protein [Vicinamibacterales bacterium]|jgi:iron-sulfur cluster assembly protein|nr:Fe-S cluster assembly scaffold SufA [Acidobacteriota bacterium]MDP7293875.1 iron-sulfur cluster assembly accessory protein [Vicinamibacterales bacterium]MDP7471841.1 iron-sulfur cluster assembly accessory protein [Vicinamibacterales bacterium]MDP7670695.1 iron-sulfur cluster assembly accessory protein [Vicinamibacterales bacterium]HJO39022.1 iron-sulfur cluster assembly accessory protein [Vicinamibacterales bacterium]|tara:strand:+ start:1509 stop:1835 length:327 start_codon:yes stop_codon:yes gene_type:complete